MHQPTMIACYNNSTLHYYYRLDKHAPTVDAMLRNVALYRVLPTPPRGKVKATLYIARNMYTHL